ncbi:hypothetical protein [Acidihalobacter ferrooxydans]|uniref:Uncharacterized protein n=1 Tax=Acidihalobacter ferrooxydans TaxID=1765967 RepID=A0A1P8UFI2_9GAMM|nr:hypothetical protein [Acidihalobacter ferrooxydans]APZ42606.1 hypothetical protein BW247_05420 [Acidihalobacter ferrooxydans]
MLYPLEEPGYEARVAERQAGNVPLPYDDDDTVEHNLAFTVFLSPEQQEEVRNTSGVLEKRCLVAKYVKQFAMSSPRARG